MAIPKYKFVLTIGEDTEKIFQWKDSRKQPIDISGFHIECNLYSDANTQFASLTTSNYKILTDPNAKGKFTIVFDSDLTAVKLSSYARYEIWFTNTTTMQRKCFLVGSLAFVSACA